MLNGDAALQNRIEISKYLITKMVFCESIHAYDYCNSIYFDCKPKHDDATLFM